MKIMQKSVSEYVGDNKSFVNELVDILGEDYIDNQDDIGLRGIYEPELKSGNLQDSYEWYSMDGDSRDAVPGNALAKRGQRLDGVSTFGIVQSWADAGYSDIVKNLNESLEAAADWGDTDYIAVVRGKANLNEAWEDAGEIVLKYAAIAALIRK